MREINPGLISCSLSGYGATSPRVQAECQDRFSDANCCTSPVLDIGEALASPNTAGRGLVRRAPHGALQALFPARIDGQPPDSRPAVRSEGPPSGQPSRVSPGGDGGAIPKRIAPYGH